MDKQWIIVTELIRVNILTSTVFKWIHVSKYPESFKDVQDKLKRSTSDWSGWEKWIQRINDMNHELDTGDDVLCDITDNISYVFIGNN